MATHPAKTGYEPATGALVEAVLRDVGFARVTRYSQTPRAARTACALPREHTEGADPGVVAQQGRAVFHAHK